MHSLALIASLLIHDPQARIDRHGLLFYEESLPVASAPLAKQTSWMQASDVADAETFKLHSRPGARGIIYINFQGENVNRSAWNMGNMIHAAPYSRDADPAFSAQELDDIRTHWLSVAEDYSPFNVDVTTERPTQYDPAHFIEVVVTPTNEWYGNAGGVCYVNSFTWGEPLGTQVCWVFSNQLGNEVKYVAEAIAHEAGHSFGLHHWQKYKSNGDLETPFYTGNAAWAPLMGVSYYAPLTTWSKGEYTGAGTSALGKLQDDIAVINETLGIALPDEAPSTTDSQALLVAPASNGPTQVNKSGVIASGSDIDMFKLLTAGGAIELLVSPAIVAPNLDLGVKLFDSKGAVKFESNPEGVAPVQIKLSDVAAGTYYLQVSPQGQGDPRTTGYSAYGSAGQYQITGQFVAAPTNATPTPTPTPSPTPVPNPPKVQMLNPQHGGTVAYRANIMIVAGAEDDGQVKRVRIFVDGDQVCSKATRAPSVTVSCSYSVRNMIGSYLTINAEATDNTGAKTVSTPIRVTVIK